MFRISMVRCQNGYAFMQPMEPFVIIGLMHVKHIFLQVSSTANLEGLYRWPNGNAFAQLM